MDDLISRQAAIDLFQNLAYADWNQGAETTWADAYSKVAETICYLPSAEPDRKTGKWERHYSRPGVFADLFWHCSCCGYKNENQYANVYHKFCPHCGADMRGEEDG